jgi:hypothetical protein
LSYTALAAYSVTLNTEYIEADLSPEDAAWEDSPFNWIRDYPSGTRGAIGRDLVASILSEIAPPVARDGMVLETAGKRIRVKFSMAWDSASFRFQQVRDEDFDYVFCLGLYPDAAFAWFIPKDEFYVDGVPQERDGVTGQHGGALGSDTRWLEVNPDSVVPWLTPYGGTLAQAETVVAASL